MKTLMTFACLFAVAAVGQAQAPCPNGQCPRVSQAVAGVTMVATAPFAQASYHEAPATCSTRERTGPVRKVAAAVVEAIQNRPRIFGCRR